MSKMTKNDDYTLVCCGMACKLRKNLPEWRQMAPRKIKACHDYWINNYFLHISMCLSIL